MRCRLGACLRLTDMSRARRTSLANWSTTRGAAFEVNRSLLCRRLRLECCVGVGRRPAQSSRKEQADEQEDSSVDHQLATVWVAIECIACRTPIT